MEELSDTTKVTRVEVINTSIQEGRVFVKYGLKDVTIELQDEGRTLKVFIRNDQKP
jgi:hypothetical protein